MCLWFCKFDDLRSIHKVEELQGVSGCHTKRNLN